MAVVLLDRLDGRVGATAFEPRRDGVVAVVAGVPGGLIDFCVTSAAGFEEARVLAEPRCAGAAAAFVAAAFGAAAAFNADCRRDAEAGEAGAAAALVEFRRAGVAKGLAYGGWANGAKSGSSLSARSCSTILGKTSPLFPCRCNMPALLLSVRSTMGSTRMIMDPAERASATIREGPPVVSIVPMMKRTSQLRVASMTVLYL
mmetsp:Transcript_9742/g.25543  ORF Transcript_9742/g.25543 Transcript_9742/m.25543 type:complete len:202 (-) Transcript_9742:975-1580(-)